MLAFLPSQQVDQISRGYRFVTYTGRTLRNAAALRAELNKVRQLGYAVDNEEFEEGLRCIGAPIRDHTGRVIAAVSIAGPRFRLTCECTPSLVRKVTPVASDLSEALGYNGLQSSSRSNELVAAHAAGS